MAEKCPLSGGGHSIGSIPEFCEKNCLEIWERARREQAPELDWYLVDTQDVGECEHERHAVNYSHNALQAIGDSGQRLYSTVDECAGCRTELMETSYRFNCPHN